jgi:hypothetical protein
VKAEGAVVAASGCRRKDGSATLFTDERFIYFRKAA